MALKKTAEQARAGILELEMYAVGGCIGPHHLGRRLLVAPWIWLGLVIKSLDRRHDTLPYCSLHPMEFTMRFIALACLLPLCACVIPEPVVSGFNGDSVSIQGPGLSMSPPGAEDTALANATCADAGKRARYASTRMVGEARVEYLFLCV